MLQKLINGKMSKDLHAFSNCIDMSVCVCVRAYTSCEFIFVSPFVYFLLTRFCNPPLPRFPPPIHLCQRSLSRQALYPTGTKSTRSEWGPSPRRWDSVTCPSPHRSSQWWKPSPVASQLLQMLTSPLTLRLIWRLVFFIEWWQTFCFTLTLFCLIFPLLCDRRI